MRKIKALLTVLCACLFMGAFSACDANELFSDVSNASIDSAALDSLSEWLESNASEVDSDHTHEWTFEVVTKPATCEEKGETTYFCQCGTSYKEEIPALGHSFTDYISDDNATCMRDGTKTATCDNGCGKTHTKTDVGSMTDHVYEAVVTPATCTIQGYTTYTCECGYSYIGDFVPAKQHEYTTVVSPATCLERGYTTYTCECGYSYVGNYTSKLNHSFTYYVSNNNATCTEDGTVTAYCDYGCGASETLPDAGSMKDHTYVSEVTDATCTAQGYTTYTCVCGDSYVGDYTDIIPHSFTNYIPNGDATCTSDGTKTATCDYGCGASETIVDVGSMKDHAYVSDVTPATCTAQGYTTYTCACGDSYVSDYTDIIPHSFTNYIPNGDATCTEAGTKTAYCDYGCGASDTIDDDSPISGHTWDNGVVTTQPTCTANGVKTFTCHCGATYTAEVSKLSHSYTNYIPNGDATCEEDGTKTAYCDYGCGNSATLPDIGSATEHHYVETVIAPKCTAQGYTKYTCDCGASYRGNYTAMIPHSYTNYVSNGDATCMTDGTKTAYCDYACGASETIVDVGSATGHTFVNGECACGAIEWRYNDMDEWGMGLAPVIIRSVAELNDYVANYPYADMQEVVDTHGAEYFEKNALVIFGYTYSTGSPAEYTYEEKAPIIAGVSITIPVEKTVGEYCEMMVGAAVMTYSNVYLEIAQSRVENCTTVDVQINLVHTYRIHGYDYCQYNETQHWYACSCGEIDETTVEAHSGGTATCQSPATCSVCNQAYGVIGEHTYVDNVCTVCGDTLRPASEGLEFTLNDDNVSYSVTGIGTCKDTDIVIPSMYNGLPVTGIGDRAFYDCDSLTSVIIGDSVTSISIYAFAFCGSLTSVEIPDSVTSIGYNAFYLCELLTSVYIKDLVNWCGIIFANYEANPLHCAKNLYLNNELVTDLVIPNSVTSIGDKAFYWCTSLTSVVIPDSVTSIGDSAFDCCTSLTSVVIGDSVTSIGDLAFYNCNSLTSVVIGDSVTHIGDSAFDSCTSLTSVIIGNSVTSIGIRAFSNCTSLTSVEISGSVMSIGDYAFYYCRSLTSVVIPDSVTSIGDWAFYNCTSLTSVEIGNSVTSIGNYAFCYCTSLTSVVIPDSVTSIGNYAFYNCTSLTSVEIGNSVTSIGYRAFDSCTSLTSVEIGNLVTSIGDWAFYNCTSLTSVEIGNSVTSIGNYAFYNCNSLTNVEIGNSVTSIGDLAFYNCDSLTSITFADMSNWYRTNNSTNWENKTGGTQTDLTNASTNATYFTDTYKDYYWYKL